MQRIQKLVSNHKTHFGTEVDAVFSTPGRTELGGNHTDHNLGKVLAGSINLDTMAAVHVTSDNIVRFASDGYSDMVIDLSNLDIRENEKNTSMAIIRGVAASIVARGGNVGGFCANATSDVLRGSGLSSSAAFEVLVATILNDLYNDNKFSVVELAIMGQEAENRYFGKPSGLMDQLACAHGGIVKIDFKDNAHPLINPLSVDFKDFGYDFVVVNTGGSHADLTADYSYMPNEMKQVAAFFGKKVLREITLNQFLDNVAEVRKTINNDRALLRAYHYLTENERVDRMYESLLNREFNRYLDAVKESGLSSFKYLQNVYCSSATKEQGISLALALTENFLQNEGACRVQGGGFAGTIEAYIPQDKTEAYFKYMDSVFGQNSCLKLAIRNNPTGRISY